MACHIAPHDKIVLLAGIAELHAMAGFILLGILAAALHLSVLLLTFFLFFFMWSCIICILPW
jgi:hypothetical protein